jgi:hypothetical protein
MRRTIALFSHDGARRTLLIAPARCGPGAAITHIAEEMGEKLANVEACRVIAHRRLRRRRAAVEPEVPPSLLARADEVIE